MIFMSNRPFILVGLPEPPELSVGCSSDDDCPEYTACRNRKCINPCAVDEPCAPTAICKVVNHNPVCTCPNGFIGSPHTRCSPRKCKPSVYESTIPGTLCIEGFSQKRKIYMGNCTWIYQEDTPNVI